MQGHFIEGERPYISRNGGTVYGQHRPVLHRPSTLQHGPGSIRRRIFRKETQTAEVNSKHRYAAVGHQFGGGKEGAVTADGEEHIRLQGGEFGAVGDPVRRNATLLQFGQQTEQRLLGGYRRILYIIGGFHIFEPTKVGINVQKFQNIPIFVACNHIGT